VTVRAAGGVVVRKSREGVLEIVVVHRPRRVDWTLPKGKLEPGETAEEAALREVQEETGLWCRLGAFAGSTEYVDHAGRPKVVDYWVMEPLRGTFVPSTEVDETRWVDREVAATLLSYPRDRELLAGLDRVLESLG
jgi:8-oxo-dGTP pyrophosphatase MutT (NUDIX family)